MKDTINLTIKDVVEMTVNELSDLSVPVGMIESIGIPISRAIRNLNACLDAMEKQEPPAEESEKEPLQSDE